MLEEKQREVLEKGLGELDLNKLPIDKIDVYLAELERWNKVYNLTGFKYFEDQVYRNVLDCLAVQPYILGKRMMDLGTGAGLPGLLLALVKPDQQWVLLDGNGKKIRFLNQVKGRLDLPNVEVIHSRAEDFQTQETFDGICSRAFDKIPDSLNLCHHLFKPTAYFYALKGKIQKEDTEQLPHWAALKKIVPIKVPRVNEERHLITISVQK